MTPVQNTLSLIAEALAVPVQAFFDPTIRHRLSDIDERLGILIGTPISDDPCKDADRQDHPVRSVPSVDIEG